MNNPKQIGSNLIDCVPQEGPCPNDCNQCYYNICFYAGHKPVVPTPLESVGKIVRMNSGHDSNIQKDLVLETAKQYKDVFFNTSIPDFEFPGPVVYTINPEEEKPIEYLDWELKDPRIMFVRIRVSATNYKYVSYFADRITHDLNVPVVLTLMRYKTLDENIKNYRNNYVQKQHISNEWYVPTAPLIHTIMTEPRVYRNKLIHMCGSFDSDLCKDCGLCEAYYKITKKRLELTKQLKG